MNCGISDTEWTDYLDEALSFRDRQKIDAHLRLCSHCRSELLTLRQIDQRLRIECGLLQQAIDISEDSQSAAQDRILAVLREASPNRSPEPNSHERLWRVRWVLALLCGSNTATRIIEAAESHTDAAADSRPSEPKWPVVLRRLCFLTTEICGSYAGDLIWAVGQ
jgi:anti-sigma factor RsiW